MSMERQGSRRAPRLLALASVLCALLALAAASPQARAQFGAPVAAEAGDIVTLAPSLKGAAKAGGRAELVLSLSIKEPFHINANPASEDYLIATQVLVGKAAGLKAGKPAYPKPEVRKFAFYPKGLKVYEGTVQVRVPLAFATSYKGAPVAGELTYQACNDQSCMAPVTVRWKATAGAQKKVVAPASTSSETPPATGATVSAGAGTEADAVALRNRFGVKGLPTLVFLDAKGKERADLRAGEELTLASMGKKLAAVREGSALATESGSASDWGARLQGSPLWIQLGIAFLGGLVLNLTPCVYPMIPITVGYFGSQSEGRAGKTFGLALCYVLGLALVYSVLGVFAARTGSLFGATMQSPWVLGGVALVMGGLGLSMAGLFTINPPRWAMSQAGAKKGALGALAMGALLGVVAAPCVGPAVAALLTIVAARADMLYGFLMFFVLALGLGLPYLLLGTFSGSAKSLPRAGAWMEKSKKIFAVPLVLAGFYYGYMAFRAVPASASTAVAAEMSSKGEAVGAKSKSWPHATLATLEEARAQNRPVVLDFRADWCLPCLKMEEEIFQKDATRKAAQQHEVVLLQVDLTRAQG